MSEQPTFYVIDDDHMVLKSLTVLFRSYGLPVVGFDAADEFLRSVKVDSVGCVITDLRMPGMDGGQLQNRLLAVGSSLSVIVVTGHADVPDTVDLINRGAVTVLEKPFNSAVMFEAVQKALARSRETFDRMHASQDRVG